MEARTLIIKDFGKDYGFGRFSVGDGYKTLTTSNNIAEIMEYCEEELYDGYEPDFNEPTPREDWLPEAREKLIMERGVEIRDTKY